LKPSFSKVGLQLSGRLKHPRELHQMYSYDTEERFNFCNVDEGLTILAVASEVMYVIAWSHEVEMYA